MAKICINVEYDVQSKIGYSVHKTYLLQCYDFRTFCRSGKTVCEASEVSLFQKFTYLAENIAADDHKIQRYVPRSVGK
jgi:hypothetical protein